MYSLVSMVVCVAGEMRAAVVCERVCWFGVIGVVGCGIELFDRSS